MRITRVTIVGLRSLDETVELDPVSIFVGPNGSGKSAVVGGIAYALTGRFPGFLPTDAKPLLALANDSSIGFCVRITTDSGVTVERGVGSLGKLYLKVHHDGQLYEKATQANAVIAKVFGNVSWAVDAFDPERSIWRESPEKRLQWAFALCAGASGWTRDRLIAELGSATGDWDPKLGEDVGSCMQANVSRLHERVLAAQKVVREAKTIADGIAVPAMQPTDEEIAKAEADDMDANEAIRELQRERADILKKNGSIERAKRDQDRLLGSLAQVNMSLSKLEPPTIQVSEMDAVAANDAYEMANLEYEDAAQAMTASAETCHTCKQRVIPDAVVARRDSALAALQEQSARIKLVDANIAAAKQFDAAWQGLTTSKQTIQQQLAGIRIEEPVTMTELDDEISAKSKRCFDTRTALADIRKAQGLFAEKRGQLAAADGATKRVTALKALYAKVKDVRDKMLADSLSPLTSALAKLDAFAPKGAWGIRAGDDGLELVYGGEGVPVSAMSAGERYRATIALLLAVASVRREPWSGLFLDAFEMVDAEAQDAVVLALCGAHHAGLVDNVFVAGTVIDKCPSVTLGRWGTTVKFYRRGEQRG